MTLFQVGDFTLASGAKSRWKIECDTLTSDDWACLAAIAAEFLPPFGFVEGVPRGGIPFAEALRPYVTQGRPLVADDVWTTGESWRRFVNEQGAWRAPRGIVVFARRPVMPPVFAIFEMWSTPWRSS